MGENSAIEWTQHTFNPWIGCQKVGLGCDHCYAEALSTARLGVLWGPGAERRRTAASTWAQPRRWNRRAAAAGRRDRVFCASLADVMDPDAPEGAREDLGQLVLETPSLDWLFLTKRIGNAAKMLPAMFPAGLPANVWLGATIVNQAEADRDIIKLRQTKYDLAIRRIFLSIEPLLGPISVKDHMWPVHGWWRSPHGSYRDALAAGAECGLKRQALVGAEIAKTYLDWVIAGGESGPGARPSHPDWYRRLRDECTAAEVPFLFKQWGEFGPCELHPLGSATYSVITAAGEHLTGSAAVAGAPEDRNAEIIARFGKKIAGRLLDGVTHDAVPA